MISTPSEAIEAFHLTFLAHLSKDPNKAVIKGGQNLRLFFESVRHSDDLDMDVSVTSKETLKKKVDKILASPRFRKALLLYGIEIEQVSTPKQTDTTQRWKMALKVKGLSEPVHTRIEFSRRESNAKSVLGPVAKPIADVLRFEPLLSLTLRARRKHRPEGLGDGGSGQDARPLRPGHAPGAPRQGRRVGDRPAPVERTGARRPQESVEDDLRRVQGRGVAVPRKVQAEGTRQPAELGREEGGRRPGPGDLQPMSAVDLTLLLKDFPSPVVTTSEVAALMRGRVDSANKMLGRLTTKGVVKPLARGLWALGRDLDPKVLSRYLAAPSPSYVSLLSALRFHGMISQIPRSTYVVTLGRPQEVETSMGDFSIHTVAPEVFGGFVATPEGALIASPEKALFDVFYLSGTKPRTFSSLPEVELPDDFDFGKVRNWTRKVPSKRLRTIVERRTSELESA